MAVRLSLESEGRAPLANKTLPQAGAQLRILIVDDNAINQKVAARLLQKRGYQVESADSAKAGLTALVQQRFDLILMDLQMPDMDGFQTTVRIRKDELGSNRHVPIVALTAHALTGDREKCLAAGMDGYVSKPIQTAELYSEIDTVLARVGNLREV